MKPEFPILFAKASTIIAAPLVLITLSFYVTHAIILPASEVFPMAIAVFGITAALSGVCFTMSPSKNDEYNIRYAGEKFLHSSLLLMQSLILIYSKESLISLSYISSTNTIKTIIIAVFSALLGLISSMAAITWFHGFDALNNELWKKWEKRIDVLRFSNNRRKLAKKITEKQKK